MSKFPHYTQTESKDCGPTCLKIVAKHYGLVLNIQTLREQAETTREGSNLLTRNVRNSRHCYRRFTFN